LKSIILISSVLLLSACSSTDNGRNDDLTIANIIASSEHIVMGQLTDSFKPDDNPNTVQYVFVKEGKSWVSNDGQVIYVNAEKDNGKSKVLLEESAKKRLALLTKT
jgi:hypothetical protein